MSTTTQKLSAERVLKLNFERHAKRAANDIRSAIEELGCALHYGTREGSHATVSVPEWIAKLAAVAEECDRDVAESFVSSDK